MKDMNLKHCQFCGGTTFLVGIYPLGEKYRIGIVCISCFGRMDTKEIYSTYDEARLKAEEALREPSDA